MTVRYVDPRSTGGAQDGTSWTDAFLTLQAGLDASTTAGDILYCRHASGGSEVVAATVDFDAQAGTNAGGYVKVIGCNESGVVDGTRYKVDANGGSFSVFTFWNASDMVWLENLEVFNTAAGTYYGFKFDEAYCYGPIIINCCAHNCGSHGFYILRALGNILIRCVSYSNGADGFTNVYRGFFCCSRDNSDDGFSSAYVLYGCISHGNSDDGIEAASSYERAVINCVVDGNGDDGVYFPANTDLFSYPLIGCRITNQAGAGDIGLNCNSENVLVGYCCFDNNTDHIYDHTSYLFQFVPAEGGAATSNVQLNENAAGGGDTNQGYESATSGSEDFATNYESSTDPHLRRTAITIPWT